MRLGWISITLGILLALSPMGCRTSGSQFVAHTPNLPAAKADAAAQANKSEGKKAESTNTESKEAEVKTAEFHQDGKAKGETLVALNQQRPAAPTGKASAGSSEALLLPSIIDSDQATSSTPTPGGTPEVVNPEPVASETGPPEAGPESIATPPAEPALAIQVLSLDQVVTSVRSHFPLIQLAAQGRTIASGEALSAFGAFDHKLDLFSESQPLDFYENYRQSASLKRDTYWGGQVFAGYRIGRGIYEPWYLERETNKGGEFKAGFSAPIIRDRVIDANRAELWRAQLERQRVEPEIMAQVIQFVREGSVAYWKWVAAGANYQINEGLLELAQERNEGLIAQVEAEEKAPIDLVDNRRIIVSREAKLIDARRKLEQATIKLSLFFRSTTGDPLLADVSLLPDVTATLMPPGEENVGLLADDADRALTQRPELAELQIIRQQLNIALQQAKNETLPDVDAGLLVGQDVGEPTSSKRDKSEFEVEALITLSIPLERRKALGKIRSLRGKMAQVSAKNRFAADKVVAEVRVARAALQAAVERMQRASESFELAEQMQVAEQERFDVGQSSLFNLNAREKQLAEAAVDRVIAMLEYHVALADYAAAMGFDQPLTLGL